MESVKDIVLEESRIRDLMEEWRQAFQAKNPERIMDLYADDVMAFDLMPPLRYAGKEAYGKLWRDSLAQMAGPLSFEFHDQHFSVDEEVAYCHSLCRFRGKNTTGEDLDSWSRVTDCFRKIDGRWLITHEHTSVPIDMQTGKGMMDLIPTV